jgi:hypothetical protein
MFSARNSSIAPLIAALVAAAIAYGPITARADHKCDPVTDAGWNVVAAEETIDQVDGSPFQEGASGNWFIDRATTVLPFCHYYNAIGIYSMRSYSLAPRERKERIGICRGSAQGGSVAVPPYAGPCPPM